MLNITMLLKNGKYLYYNTIKQSFFRDCLNSNGIRSFKDANRIVAELKIKYPANKIFTEFV